MSDLRSFVEKYTGQYVEVAGSSNAKNQCVDLANAYIKEVFNQPIIEWANAVDFPSKLSDKYEFVANTPNGIPQSGSVIVFKKFSTLYGAPGHIGVVVEADVNKISVFEQNHPTGSACKVGTHDYRGCVGWFFLKDTQSPSGSTLKYTEEEMTAVRLERDKNFNDKRLAEEKVQQLTESLSQEQGKSKAIQDNFNRFVSDVAKIITSPEDTVSILSILPNYVKSSDELSKCKDLYERENKAHQKDLAESREQLKTLSNEIADMKDKHQSEINDLNIQHQKQLDYIQQKVDKAITEKEALEKQVKQYGSFLQTLDLIKSFFAKGKQ